MIFGICDLRRNCDTQSIRRTLNKTVHSCPGKSHITGEHLGLMAHGPGSSFSEDRTTKTTVAFNGEIYNHQELRRELEGEGHRFSSDLESELIMRAYASWGEDCQNRLNGVWAFAVWDGLKQKMFCSRDRFGNLPLYYHFNSNILLFSSSIRAMFSCQSVTTLPDTEVVFNYLTLGRTPRSEATFFRDIKQIEAGCCLGAIRGRSISKRRYYAPDFNTDIGNFEPKAFKRHSAEFLELLGGAVKARLCPPYPAGCMLSGGVDSSSIAYLAGKAWKNSEPGNALCASKIKAFSVTYGNEMKNIQTISKALSLEHHHISPEAITDFSWEEIRAKALSSESPLSDPSFLGELVIRGKAADENVKAILTGMGADELLGGHDGRYSQAYLNQLILAGDLRGFTNELRKFHADRLVEMGLHKGIPSDFYKIFLKNQLGVETPDQLLTGTLNHKFSKKYALHGSVHPKRLELSLQGMLRRDTFNFSNSYRSDEMRARNPFQDHRVVEFVLSLPACYKIRSGITKYLLRETMKDILPKKVCFAPKLPTPTGPWKQILKRDRAELKAVLKGKNFHASDYLDQKAVINNFDALLQEALAPGNDHHVSKLWRYVNLELWLRNNARLHSSK